MSAFINEQMNFEKDIASNEYEDPVHTICSFHAQQPMTIESLVEEQFCFECSFVEDDENKHDFLLNSARQSNVNDPPIPSNTNIRQALLNAIHNFFS